MRGLILWFGLPALALSLAGQTASPPTFSRDIRPILAKKCVSCHSEGGLGPFNLQTFEQTKKRADLVRQVVMTGQMPPTDARSDFGEMTPHQPLTPEELRTVQEWYRLGTPKGAAVEPLPSPPKVKPLVTDQVVTVAVGKGQKLPAEGRSVRVVYSVPTPPGGLGYVHSFSFQPDSPKAVRQVILAVQRPGKPEPFSSLGIAADTPVMAWGEGFNRWSATAGFVSVGDKDRLWIQVKGVPTGKAETAAGLVTFRREHRVGEAQTRTLGHTNIDIAPDAQITLKSSWVLDRDIDLISAIPEARANTEQLTITATIEGETKTLLQVLTWDQIWPGAYNFPLPVRLKKGTTITYEAYVNNSKHGHAAEEEKPKALKFGPNPTDELFWCHLTYIPR